MKKVILVILVSILVISAALFTGYQILKNKSKPNPTPIAMFTDQEPALAFSKKILTYLRDQNFAELAKDIGSDNGLIIKPYYTVSLDQGRTVEIDELNEFINNKTIQHWGIYDASGLPMDLTNSDYYSKFIYSGDFYNQAQVSFNKSLVQANTQPLDTVLSSIFSGRNISYIEYYLPGTEQNSNMDWQSLVLVLENNGGVWNLVGILHGQWAI